MEEYQFHPPTLLFCNVRTGEAGNLLLIKIICKLYLQGGDSHVSKDSLKTIPGAYSSSKALFPLAPTEAMNESHQPP